MTHRPSTAPLLGIDLLRALTTTTFFCDNYFFFKTATTTSSNLRQLPLLLRQLPLLLRQLPLLLRRLPFLLRQLPLLLRQLPPTSCDNYLLLIQICDNYLPFPATTTTTILRQLLPATTTTSCDNLQRPIMLFTCVPAIWQHVPESNQNCSDNYKAKQPLANTISPDPISDPIGAVLDYFGLLSLDISIAGCVGDVPAAALPTQATAHTRLVAERTSTSASANSSCQLYCQCAELDKALDQTKQIQRPGQTEQTWIRTEAETQTQTTQDMTTQDQTAPGICTADKHQIQVSAETVKLLQANIAIQHFPSDLYEAQFDPTCIELLPNFRDAIRMIDQTNPIKISDQITRQESKYSLCDFDAGPPLKSGSSVSIQFREILNGGIVWTYWFCSPLSL